MLKRSNVGVFDTDSKRFKSEDGVADMPGGLASAEVLTIIEQGGADGTLGGQPSDLGAAVDLASVTLDESGMVSAGGDAQVLNELGLGDMPQNIIIQHMDIAEPLSTLRTLLEERLGLSLSDHEFVLTDTLPLDINKNLVEQCVQGEGVVQINVEVKSTGMKRVNIVDILKPADDFVPPQSTAPPAPPPAQPPAPANQQLAQSEHVTRWIVDQKFRRGQEQLGIPLDPAQWSVLHVKHWIKWAVREFGLVGVRPETFNLTGQDLCGLKHDAFVRYIPHDPGDVFWTHLELLRKCKFVAVVQQPAPQAITTVTVATSGAELMGGRKYGHKVSRPRSPRITGDDRTPGNRSGNNGQIQLWQFLLELLTDRDCREVIQWLGEDGEFKLMNPELVAQLWGARKNKPTMNYEKLSRALRYYYDGDMIAKVHGKKFVYKFICDLRGLLGYSAGELSQLVIESSDRKFQKIREMHNLLKKTQ